jgi:N-acyl homoserine lactone hydrolase
MRSPDDVRPLNLCDVEAFGRTVPVFAWAVTGDGATVLVDTGMIDSTPELDAKWKPTLHPWPDLGDVRAVINTHLHFDHCGGNRRFAGIPTFVQRAELEAAVETDYLVDWIRFSGESYELVDGDAEILPGISVLFTPGHSPGHQAVVVETGEGPVVLAGDVTYDRRELPSSDDPSIRRIRELGPRRVYISHSSLPWEPGVD